MGQAANFYNATINTNINMWSQTGRIIESNNGYNSLLKTLSTPILGSAIVDKGTGATFTNNTVFTNYGSPKEIVISGGTVLTITKDCTPTGKTDGEFFLNPWDTFNVTYSVTSTIVCYQE
jgi:hypothetical protein